MLVYVARFGAIKNITYFCPSTCIRGYGSLEGCLWVTGKESPNTEPVPRFSVAVSTITTLIIKLLPIIFPVAIVEDIQNVTFVDWPYTVHGRRYS